MKRSRPPKKLCDNRTFSVLLSPAGIGEKSGTGFFMKGVIKWQETQEAN